MLLIEQLVKTFPGDRHHDEPRARVRAIDDVDIEVQEAELFTLLGPSGCGKTTTLRSVAGLETPDSGRISVAGRVLYDSARGIRVPANQRRLGMVFQSYAIWPHMTVFENAVFPMRALPKRDRPNAATMRSEVDRVLTMLQLDQLASRPATNLSGGQQQRLALARALVVRPEVLLLDEPLSNLDAKLRESLRLELKRLQRETGQTTVYVTHDQSEALAMSSRIAVMKQGVVQQIGKPRDVYDRPANFFVAEFIGSSNFLDGQVVSGSGTQVVVESAVGPLAAECSEGQPPVGTAVKLSIRPEAMLITPPEEPPPNGPALKGVVRTRAYLGDAIDHVVEISGVEFRVRSNPSLSFAPGETVCVGVQPQAVRVLAGDGS